MKFKAIIFDLDGTLLNSLDDLADCVNEVLIKYRFPAHEPLKFKQFIGDGVINLIKRALPENIVKDELIINKIVHDFRIIYTEKWAIKTKPYDYVTEVLEELQNKKIQLNILSNKPDDFTKIMVDKFFKQIHFNSVWGEREGIPRKPDPQSVIEIVKKSGFTNKEFIFVGDSAGDIKTAINSDVIPVGVSWGYRSIKELTDAGASVVINHPSGLLKIIE